MSTTRIRRGTAPQRTLDRRKPVARGTTARGPARPVRAVSRTSRIDAWIARLPITPAFLQWIINGAIAVVLAVVFVTVLHAMGVTAKIGDEWARMVRAAGFEVRSIEVVGADRIDRMKVYDIALRNLNRSMAAVDLDAVRGDLLQYGWIADARVSRRLPDTLVVDIVERTPAAVWQHNRRLSLIDEKGVVLETIDSAALPDLPLLIGPNANLRSRDLAALLSAAPSLRPLLAGATWVGNRRWDLRFESGEVLSLPEGTVTAKRALAEFARMDGVNRLLGRGVVRFDMRDPSRFVLRLPPEGAVREGAEAVAADIDGASVPVPIPAKPAGDDATSREPAPSDRSEKV